MRRCAAQLDETVFSLPKEKRRKVLAEKKDYIIRRLNADFQKVWFGRNAAGEPCDLHDMTYAGVAERVLELCYVADERRWIDPSYMRLLADVCWRAEERVRERAAGQASLLQSASEFATEPAAVLRRVLDGMPRAREQILSSEGAAAAARRDAVHLGASSHAGCTVAVASVRTQMCSTCWPCLGGADKSRCRSSPRSTTTLRRGSRRTRCGSPRTSTPSSTRIRSACAFCKGPSPFGTCLAPRSPSHQVAPLMCWRRGRTLLALPLLPGPRYSTVADEPAQTILDGIMAGLAEHVSTRCATDGVPLVATRAHVARAAGSGALAGPGAAPATVAFRVPTEPKDASDARAWLAQVAAQLPYVHHARAGTRGDLRRSPCQSALARGLGTDCSSGSPLSALLTTPTVVRGHRLEVSPVQRLLRPRPGQLWRLTGLPRTPCLHVFDGAVAPMGTAADELDDAECAIAVRPSAAAAPSEVEVVVHHRVDRRSPALALRLLFRFVPTQPAYPIHEVMDGRNARIKGDVRNSGRGHQMLAGMLTATS